MCLKTLLNQASSRLYSTATLSLPSNGKEFHIISSETYSNVFSRHKHMCSRFGLKRICILYFDSDFFFFIHHVQQTNEMLGTGLDGIHFYKQSG